MASLSGTTPAATYPALIKFNDNSAISGSLRLLSDGAGGASPLYLSATQLNIGGTGAIAATIGIQGAGTTSATSSIIVRNSSGNNIYNLYNNGAVDFMSSGSTIGQVTTNGITCYSFKALGGFGGGKLNLESVCDLHSEDGTLAVRVGNAHSGITDPTAIGQTTAPVGSAMLEAVSTTKGFLPPRMTTAQKNAIATPAAGLILYDTTLNKLCVFTTAWETITSV